MCGLIRAAKVKWAAECVGPGVNPPAT